MHAVLLEVRPEVHLVPFEDEEGAIVREQGVDQRDDVLAQLTLGLMHYTILEVELLRQLVVLLETLIPVCPEEVWP